MRCRRWHIADGRNGRRSFEIFRNACKDVDVVTFDELLQKLRLLQGHPNASHDVREAAVPF